jgi:hypothetical protein
LHSKPQNPFGEQDQYSSVPNPHAFSLIIPFNLRLQGFITLVIQAENQALHIKKIAWSAPWVQHRMIRKRGESNLHLRVDRRETPPDPAVHCCKLLGKIFRPFGGKIWPLIGFFKGDFVLKKNTCMCVCLCKKYYNFRIYLP